MKNKGKFMTVLLLLLAAALLSACGKEEEPVTTTDPHENMVEVPSGIGSNEIWVKLYDSLPISDPDISRFYESDGLLGYSGTDYRTIKGIDVSEHQGDVDFAAVKAAGIDYVILRAGYRGCTEGGLNEDAYFVQNMENARAAGLDIGIYFFSQSLSTEEAEEEADFLTGLISLYSDDITLPVFYDWETVEMAGSRTESVPEGGLTDMTEAFCKKMQQAGYETGVYASRTIAYYSLDLESLADNDIALWITAVGDTPDFYYSFEYWQYSVTGTVDGISGEVDLDLRMISAESLGIKENSGSAKN